MASKNIDGVTESGVRRSKRKIQLTPKALQNAIEDKRREILKSRRRLLIIMRSVEETTDDTDIKTIASDLTAAAGEFGSLLQGLLSLYEQDLHGEFIDGDQLKEENETLKRALLLIDSLKNRIARQSDELLETRSVYSHHSSRRSLVSSTSSSVARLQALADARAASQEAQYTRLRAEKELERRTRDAEAERTRQQEKARYEKELKILGADKKAAVANAKLKVFEEALLEQELERDSELPSLEVPRIKNEERTSQWVHSSPTLNPPPVDYRSRPRRTQESSNALEQSKPLSPSAAPKSQSFSQDLPNKKAQQDTPFNRGPIITSTPLIDVTGSQLIETLTSVNQQIVAGLARQNLPKCHPDVFSGDPTLFHPWKAAFKAMITDVSVSPVQEINYLRSITSGEPQKLVDNYRKRKHHDPCGLLKNLWAELERRFGSAATITNALLERMHALAAFRESENDKLQEFADLCADVTSQISCLPGLACLNFPNAIQPIAAKLPPSLRGKWEKELAKFSENNGDAYPGFHVFSEVVQKHARIKNNPNINIGARLANPPIQTPSRAVQNKKALKTNTDPKDSNAPTRERETKRCPFHDRDGHSLEECKAFAAKTLEEKTEWILQAGLCYRCLSEGHRAKDCRKTIRCSICKDKRHNALLHKEKLKRPEGGESVDTKCTSLCGASEGGVSCSKLVLVDVASKERPKSICRVYAIIDDQSNTSLITSELADELGATGAEEKYYLTTCSGEKEAKYGRRVTGVVLKSLKGTESELPTLIECNNIPRDKQEIPTPEMARRFPHLSDIANEIPQLDENAEIHLLIGRDAPELLKVREFRNGPNGAPWAQKTSLGWTIIGQMCLDLVGGPVHVRACRTSLLAADSREKWTETNNYEFLPCPNQFTVKESFLEQKKDLTDNVFITSREDNDVSLSCEDRKFLDIMETGVHKNEQGNWEMPLPFRRKDLHLPNNRSQAVNRLNGLIRTLKRKPQMAKDYVEFMGKIIEKGHASPVPMEEIPRPQSGRVWYLPHFGVYHPKKPTQIRVVFDSSAEYEGVSLNGELLSGPDLMNSLLGVLLRFRRETTAVMCDIEQMFHSFHVDPEHRDFLRFLWYEDNTPGKRIMEYRMNVHLFGNGPSPAVATFGLRKTAVDGEEEFGENAAEFVHRNFYVDDGLASRPTTKEAIDLVTATQAMLATANLKLHKVVSNSVEVMEAFPAEDRGKGVRDLDLRHDSLPAQRSLGVYWNLEEDTFTFKVCLPEKPFTRRGVLSVVNSIYDPLGLAVPVLLEGKLLLQQLVLLGKKNNKEKPLGWDDPLPDTLLSQWQRWRNSLPHLENVSVPRCYHPPGFGRIVRREIHAFSDASKDAIGASIYLRLFNDRGGICTALLFGQSKVAPAQTTSIPRLELCAAVLASQAVNKIVKEIDMEMNEITFYTDSKVVLGYIQNESRRFYVYVANRVQTIRKISSPKQWKYVDTSENPADLSTRCLNVQSLTGSDWLTGRSFLRDPNRTATEDEEDEIPLNENDPEVRKNTVSLKTQTSKHHGLGADRFSRFSSLHSLQRAIANLIVVIKEFKRRKNKSQEEFESKISSSKNTKLMRQPTAKELQEAMTVIIRAVQSESLSEELKSERKIAENNKPETIPKSSKLYRLDPFLDNNGVLRVGGRLRRATLEFGEKHPVLIPKKNHAADLITRHYHRQVHHQGRQITHGAIRQAGYWLIGGHNTVARDLNKCVTCKKLRGPVIQQRMADLPADRTEVAPPFTNVGFDVFGPWMIRSRKTRGGAANSKRWGLVFTCLSSRAIHIELLESMDASSFICALRKFFALRGPVSILRCDRGTNFVGGKSELEDALREMDQRQVKGYVNNHGCEWIFNPPHASHFGGAWERQIGTIRRVLEAMFAELGSHQMTHELLVTLMAEVTAIVNARPISAIPTDADEPHRCHPLCF